MQADNKNSHAAIADDLANSIYMQIMANRERLLNAFIAETGLRPSECEVVMCEVVENGNVYLVTSVRKKLPQAFIIDPSKSNLKVTP